MELTAVCFTLGIAFDTELGLDQTQMIFRELVARGAATLADAQMMEGELLKNSEWKKAKALTELWPALGWIPDFVSDPGLKNSDLSYLTLSPDLSTLTQTKLQLTSGPQIIMYGDCHFAVYAIAQLAAHPDISEIMGDLHGLVLASVDNNDFVGMNQQREQYPGFENHPIFKSGNWYQNGYNIIDMPNFIFLRDGVVQYSAIGAQDAVQSFCRGLKAIGLSSIPACSGN